MPFKSQVFGAGKIFLLLAGLLATYLIFAMAAMRIVVRAREVVVPDLTGRSVNEASALLSDHGLALRVEDGRRIHPTIKADLILAQDPPPGVTARQQRSIKAWLSAGPRPSKVPLLVGETEQAAQARLRADTFGISGLAEIRSADYPTGAVVAQTPPPDAPGTEVSLLVNRGERAATYVMPDLIGVAGDRAAEFMRTRGFRVAVVGDHPYPGISPGIVLRQHPQAGFQIAPGEPISLEVSR